MISPLVSIVIAYVSGIIFGKMVSLPLWLSFCLLIFLLLVSFYLLLANKQSIFIFLLALIFVLGFFYVQLKNVPTSSVPNGKIELVGRVVNEPSVFEDRISFILDSKQGKLSVLAPLGKVCYGDRVWVKGFISEIDSLENPGIFSFKNYLEKQGIGARLIAKEKIRVLAKGGNWFKKASISVRNRLIKIPGQTLPEPYATLLSSIVFGSRAVKLSPKLKESYRRAGVAHLLVASGMHLGILIGVILAVGGFLKLPVWARVVLASSISWLYAIMVGAGSSILRAAVMIQIAMLSLLFEREKDFVAAFSLAALVILVLNPLTLFEVGFQLSFAATWGLVYIAPVIAGRLKELWPALSRVEARDFFF